MKEDVVMDIQWILAQTFGLFGVIVFILMYHFNKMEKVLCAKLLMDILWAMHYLLLVAYTGFATNLVCGFREIVFMNNKKKIFCSRIWLWIFVLTILSTSFFTWQGWYSILPATASALATFSFWQKNVNFARCVGMINNILMFSYDVLIGSYTGMIGETFAFISIFLAILKAHKSQTANQI